MPIVCHRHTSSKLSNIEDLNRLNTYGFRGEALCSMSQVAKVTISTKKRNQRVGYEATYEKGRLRFFYLFDSIDRNDFKLND